MLTWVPRPALPAQAAAEEARGAVLEALLAVTRLPGGGGGEALRVARFLAVAAFVAVDKPAKAGAGAWGASGHYGDVRGVSSAFFGKFNTQKIYTYCFTSDSTGREARP
jgi:hypothetical protein